MTKHRKYRRYSKKEKERYNQEKELSEYYAKPTSERAIIQIGKGAQKFDEYLESLRSKKENLGKQITQVKNIIVPRAKELKKEFVSIGRPINRFFVGARKGVMRGIKPTPTRPRLPRLY